MFAGVGMLVTGRFLIAFFLFIVGLVKSGALEYYAAAAAYKAMKFTSAFGAFLDRIIGHALKYIKMFPAFIAFVFVSRHFI